METGKTRSIDELMMAECLRLAEKGKGHVSPNPMVGAVSVRKGSILSRGYHRRFGGPHAEIECLRKSRRDARGATLYVNLEPCSYFGKTPPCTEAILRAGIRRVVIGMKDPNPLVSGRGIRRLRRQGVDVQVGVLRKEAEELNRAFRKHITTGLPYVHLKIAQTVDGKIAPIGERKFWLTSEQSRGIVHRWRAQHDAVLVGAGTIRADDPLLTARKIAGRNPDAVILDGRLAVDPRSRVFVRGRQRRVFLCVDRTYARRHTTKVTQLEGMGVRVLRFAGRSGIIPLRGVLRALYGEGIGSLLVEGGATVFRHFVEQSMVDELSLFVAPWIMGDGVAAFGGLSVLRGRRRKKLTWLQPERIGTDLLLRAYSL